MSNFIVIKTFILLSIMRANSYFKVTRHIEILIKDVDKIKRKVYT